MFSPVATDYWHATFRGARILSRGESFTVAVDPGLREERRVMMLATPGDGMAGAVLTPSVADTLGLAEPPGPSRPLTQADFRRALAEAGVSLHGADHVFYFTEADRQALLEESPHEHVRRLAQDDAATFAAFEASASEQDLDDAYVELDHWAVFGALAHNRLVTAASAYPWEGARLADIGVLTLPSFRGQGHGRAVVRALAQYAAQQGYEPQYRCQLDNAASIALAKAAGFTHFGTWEVISADSSGT